MNILITIMVIGPLATSLPLEKYFAGVLQNSLVYAFDFLFNLRIRALPEVFEHSRFTVNDSLWTLAIEFSLYLYLLFFGMCNLLGKSTFPLIFLMGVYLFGVDIVFYAHDKSNPYRMAFIIGAFFYLFRDNIKFRADFAILCAGILVLLEINVFYKLFSYPFAMVALCISLPYLVFYIGFSNTIKLQNFGKYGDFSYGIYIYAFPIQQLCQLWFGNSLGFFFNFSVSLLITLLAAIFSWHCVEAPFLKRRRNTT